MRVIFLVLFVCALLSTTAKAGRAKGKATDVGIPVKSLRGMLHDYKNYCEQFPTTEQGLDALLKRPDRGPPCPRYPDSAFILHKKLPMDEWGRAWIYESDGKAFTIISYGRDGKPGGLGADADIVVRGR